MKEFNESMADPDPFRQFENWFLAAKEANVNIPNAMSLATVDAAHRPSVRVVLMQSFSPAGFVFYTNYRSRKAKEIEQNPYCCVNFFWPELQRQLRIEGRLSPVDEKTSDNYFMTRPYESRLGAWASPQSEIIPDREALENKLEKVKKEFEGKEPTRPAWWGGYLLVPDRFEFWQERESRLHDRISYEGSGNGKWIMHRLAP